MARDDFEPINVAGCVMGGDGRGGTHTKDPRIRQCGWGLVILQPSPALEVHTMFYGSVPGAQYAYRAEATQLLHALRRTTGNCVLIMDCKAVIRQYAKGPRANLRHDGLLRQE